MALPLKSDRAFQSLSHSLCCHNMSFFPSLVTRNCDDIKENGKRDPYRSSTVWCNNLMIIIMNVQKTRQIAEHLNTNNSFKCVLLHLSMPLLQGGTYYYCKRVSIVLSTARGYPSTYYCSWSLGQDSTGCKWASKHSPPTLVFSFTKCNLVDVLSTVSVL
jgi:hypothetical protein